MRKSKLIFVVLAIIFFLIMAIIAFDISSRTSFPGQNKSTTEELDSVASEQD